MARVGMRGWLTGWGPRVTLADLEPAPLEASVAVTSTPAPGIDAKLAAAQAARAGVVVTSRGQAMGLSVVNRARDLFCGVLAGCPFTRVRDYGGRVEDLGPGWLAAPDPTRTRAAFVAAVTDDLFFHGWAWCFVSAYDADGFPMALAHMPWRDVARPLEPGGDWTWHRHDPVTGAYTDTVTVADRDVLVFESPVSGVLEEGSRQVLTTSALLDDAAQRFAGTEVAAGWLVDQGTGEPLTPAEALGVVQGFQDSRRVNTIAYLRGYEYHESTLDPSRLQLVEGRSYQDAAVARVCNVPNYAVGVGVPNDSMTYKTALTARFDLIDWGLGPLLECWEQTLSTDRVVPHGTTVAMDLSGFLRTEDLTGKDTPAVAPAPAPEAAR